MITDDDLVPFEFSDFWEETDTEAPSLQMIEPDYIDRQISLIPTHGDNARWWLASYLNMFDNLNPDGSLSNEQREAVDNFVLGYQYQKSSQPTALRK